MKKTIVPILLIISAMAHAQVSNKIIYEQIDTVQGASKTELFAKSKNWVEVIFKSSRSAIQIQDSVTGQLIGKGTGGFAFKKGLGKWSGGVYYFTMQIDCKDGKSRITIYDLTVSEDAKPAVPIEESNKSAIAEIDKSVKLSLASFKQNIQLKEVSATF